MHTYAIYIPAYGWITEKADNQQQVMIKCIKVHKLKLIDIIIDKVN